MKTEWVQCFLTVARTGSMNQSAEQLYLTQPTVTKMLRALEKELGVTLFVRRNTGVELTEDGNMFLPHARAIMREYVAYQNKREERMQKEVFEGPEKLELACSSLLLQVYYKEIAAILKRILPHTTVRIIETDYDDILTLMQKNPNCIGFINMPMNMLSVMEKECQLCRLYEAPTVICFNRTSGLNAENLFRLREENFHMISLGFAYKYLEQQGESNFEQNQFQMSTTNLELAKETLMHQENMYMLLPEVIAKSFLDSRYVEWLPMSQKTEICIGLMQRKDDAGNTALSDQLMHRLESALKEMFEQTPRDRRK